MSMCVCRYTDRGIDGELVGGGSLIVQGPGDCYGPTRTINGEEGRGGLEGEEDAASCALVRVRSIHHEHRRANRNILDQGERHIGGHGPRPQKHSVA